MAAVSTAEENAIGLKPIPGTYVMDEAKNALLHPMP